MIIASIMEEPLEGDMGDLSIIQAIPINSILSQDSICLLIIHFLGIKLTSKDVIFFIKYTTPLGILCIIIKIY